MKWLLLFTVYYGLAEAFMMKRCPHQTHSPAGRSTADGLCSVEVIRFSSESVDDRLPETDDKSINSGDSSFIEQQEPLLQTSTNVKIDDGGSDLTNRFKYKVNALMGTYDPVGDAVDDERQEGNILNALLQFPTKHSFTAVGRTEGDAAIAQAYAEEVKGAVLGIVGVDEKDLLVDIIPRAPNHLKVVIQAEVQSASMINLVFDSLEKLERTKMRF